MRLTEDQISLLTLLGEMQEDGLNPPYSLGQLIIASENSNIVIGNNLEYDLRQLDDDNYIYLSGKFPRITIRPAVDLSDVSFTPDFDLSEREDFHYMESPMTLKGLANRGPHFHAVRQIPSLRKKENLPFWKYGAINREYAHIAKFIKDRLAMELSKTGEFNPFVADNISTSYVYGSGIPIRGGKYVFGIGEAQAKAVRDVLSEFPEKYGKEIEEELERYPLEIEPSGPEQIV